MSEYDASVRRIVRSITANLGRWGVFVMDSDSSIAVQMITIVDETWPGSAVVRANEYSNWMGLEKRLLELSTQSPLIHVIGLDGWMNTGNNHAANIRREAFAHSVSVPVLFWMDTEQIRAFATEAPDLWSWRAGVFSAD
jgi:hypothetical protein